MALEQTTPLPGFDKVLEKIGLIGEMRRKMMAELRAAIKVMEEALEKPHGQFVALQMASSTVMPKAMEVMGGGIGAEAAKLDIGSALRLFNSYIQGNFDTIKGDPTNDSATRFLNGLKDLWGKVLNGGEWKEGLGFGRETFDSLVSFVKTTTSLISGGKFENPYFPTPSQVKDWVKAMFDPTKPLNPTIAAIQNAFREFNNVVSIPMQQTQIELQYLGQQYNQNVGTMKNILDSQKNLNGTLVKGQIAR